jgi:hypothetical protein
MGATHGMNADNVFPSPTLVRNFVTISSKWSFPTSTQSERLIVFTRSCLSDGLGP